MPQAADDKIHGAGKRMRKLVNALGTRQQKVNSIKGTGYKPQQSNNRCLATCNEYKAAHLSTPAILLAAKIFDFTTSLYTDMTSSVMFNIKFSVVVVVVVLVMLVLVAAPVVAAADSEGVVVFVAAAVADAIVATVAATVAVADAGVSAYIKQQWD